MPVTVVDLDVVHSEQELVATKGTRDRQCWNTCRMVREIRLRADRLSFILRGWKKGNEEHKARPAPA
jgi:hypothetical protein